MKCITIFAVVAMALAAVAQEPAAEGKKRVRMRPERPMIGGAGMGAMDPVMRAVMNPMVAKQLGLSEEQSAKLKALGDDRATNRELQEKLRKGMQRQNELLQAEKIDEAAVMAAVDEVWAVRKDLAKNQIKRIVAAKSILTPEQVKKANELMTEMRGNRRAPRPESVKGGKVEAKTEATKKAKE